MAPPTSRPRRYVTRFASCFPRPSRSCARLAKAWPSGLAAVVALALAAPAQGADPGRWFMTGFSRTKIEYYQGVTSDSANRLFFDGRFVGLYRTTPELKETA